MYRPCKSWDKLPINGCRISSINSSTHSQTFVSHKPNFYQTRFCQDQPFFSTASPKHSLNRRNSNSSIFNGLVVNRWDLAGQGVRFSSVRWMALTRAEWNHTCLWWGFIPLFPKGQPVSRRCKSFIADDGHLAFLAGWKSMGFSQEDIYS